MTVNGVWTCQAWKVTLVLSNVILCLVALGEINEMQLRVNTNICHNISKQPCRMSELTLPSVRCAHQCRPVFRCQHEAELLVWPQLHRDWAFCRRSLERWQQLADHWPRSPFLITSSFDLRVVQFVIYIRSHLTCNERRGSRRLVFSLNLSAAMYNYFDTEYLSILRWIIIVTEQGPHSLILKRLYTLHMINNFCC